MDRTVKINNTRAGNTGDGSLDEQRGGGARLVGGGVLGFVRVCQQSSEIKSQALKVRKIFEKCTKPTCWFDAFI